MPPILPKRCSNCAARCAKTGENLAYWACPTCGWTDDPAALQPLSGPVDAASEGVPAPEPDAQ